MGVEFINFRERILNLIAQSNDNYYNQFMRQLLRDLEDDVITAMYADKEIERTYKLYLERNNLPDPREAIQQEKAEKVHSSEHKGGMEYTVGAIIFSVVGALFLLVSFITFGINYLEGIFQGIFLYIMSFVIILISELLVKRKLTKLSHGLTGLGIAALYASTIINYMYMSNIGSITAIVITLAVAFFSVLLSRRKDSAMIRMLSFIGCYICFLSVASFNSQMEFLIAAGTLFLVNIISVFFPNQKHSSVIHNIHMGINVLFVIAFVNLASINNIMEMYIILFLILNIVLLNIANLRKEENSLSMVFYGIEIGIVSILLQIMLNELAHPYLPMSQRMFYAAVVFSMVLVISVFFYIMNREWAGKSFQYHYFIIFTLFMLAEPIGHENIWGMIILFVIAKIFGLIMDYEWANAFVTLLFLGVGIYYYDIWQGWIFLALAVLSIPTIKCFRLYYQSALALYFVLFAAYKLADFDLFLPIAATILFVLLPLFRYIVRPMEVDDRLIYSVIYNVITISALGVISFLCIRSSLPWVSAVVALIGSLAIILYINEYFYLKLKRKYLILAAYLIFMTLIIRLPNPIYTSILMMAIAAFCVWAGFKFRDKPQRICGLILAIFVCLKIGIYDFSGLESLQKTIVFMIVGTFALLISVLYFRLIKSNNEKMEEASGVIETAENKDFSEPANEPQMRREISAETSVENFEKEGYNNLEVGDITENRSEE